MNNLLFSSTLVALASLAFVVISPERVYEGYWGIDEEVQEHSVEMAQIQAGPAHARAQAYMLGLGVEVDFEEAARWLELAAAQGHPEAARDLAHYRAIDS